jgi:hypothetical protein
MFCGIAEETEADAILNAPSLQKTSTPVLPLSR